MGSKAKTDVLRTAWRSLPASPRPVPSREPRRRNLPWGDDRAPRFTRRTYSILRDPTKIFKKYVVHELGLLRAGDDPVRCVIRIAAWFLLAFRRLVELLQWRRFLVEHHDLGVCRATGRYVRLARNRGLRISQSGLYRNLAVFELHGLVGLVTEYRGGRPCKIPPRERELITELCRQASGYRLYVYVHQRLGIPDPQLGLRRYERVVEELLAQAGPIVRQKATRSALSKRNRPPRSALTGVA